MDNRLFYLASDSIMRSKDDIESVKNSMNKGVPHTFIFQKFNKVKLEDIESVTNSMNKGVPHTDIFQKFNKLKIVWKDEISILHSFQAEKSPNFEQIRIRNEADSSILNYTSGFVGYLPFLFCIALNYTNVRVKKPRIHAISKYFMDNIMADSSKVLHSKLFANFFVDILHKLDR